MKSARLPLLLAALVAVPAWSAESAPATVPAAERPVPQVSSEEDSSVIADRVTIANVFSETQLLAIIKTLQEVDGVREVRRIGFNRKAAEALLQILGADHALTTWRAQLEALPKTSDQPAPEARTEEGSPPIVERVVLLNVASESALLAIMEYLERANGVREVKRVALDRKAAEALLEVIVEADAQTAWRAYLENLPKSRVNLSNETTNDRLRKSYPDWVK